MTMRKALEETFPTQPTDAAEDAGAAPARGSAAHLKQIVRLMADLPGLLFGAEGEPAAATDAGQRVPGTLAVTLAAVAQGIQIHRVHDLGAIRQGLALWHALHDEDRTA